MRSPSLRNWAFPSGPIDRQQRPDPDPAGTRCTAAEHPPRPGRRRAAADRKTVAGLVSRGTRPPDPAARSRPAPRRDCWRLGRPMIELPPWPRASTRPVSTSSRTGSTRVAGLTPALSPAATTSADTLERAARSEHVQAATAALDVDAILGDPGDPDRGLLRLWRRRQDHHRRRARACGPQNSTAGARRGAHHRPSPPARPVTRPDRTGQHPSSGQGHCDADGPAAASCTR